MPSLSLLALLTVLAAPTSAQQAHALVRATDLARSSFRVQKRDSLACILDVVFTVEAWRDARGVVRRLSFDSLGLMLGAGGLRQVLYRDLQGRPRFYLRTHTGRLDFGKPLKGQRPEVSELQLSLDAGGHIVERRWQGRRAPFGDADWAGALKTMNADRLFREYTCLK